MSIGYASLTVHVRHGRFRTCKQSTCTSQRLREIISYNLSTLETIIDYNANNDLHLFRISSDIIPFASSPVNTLDWRNEFSDDFNRIAAKVKAAKIRISMHPGQYTVLNSLTSEIVTRSIQELWYHVHLIRALGADQTNKLILHVGGIYGDKEAAISRFILVYQTLPQDIKTHLVIENDERSYTIEDCLRIHEATGVPVVYDNLHHLLNHNQLASDGYWIKRVKETWKAADGVQKVHYSQQDLFKQRGAHSQTIDIDQFQHYYLSLQMIPDIMLEVKDKNLSAIKCVNCFERAPHIKFLEKEWSLYKYDVLSHSQKIYQQIRTLLKDKLAYPSLDFYRLIDKARTIPPSFDSEVNTLQHIWGYFKKIATPQEKATYQKLMSANENQTISITRVKSFLRKLIDQYDNAYLDQSIYL
ncbi:MAG: UV DNA damage repair endonuclease UvsE [Bacilli bacterium]